MRKLLLFILINLSVILTLKGQRNMIKGLNWTHTYETPFNCFNLSWNKPDTSLNDTLIGYNIYRDDSLYTFTTLLEHSCNPCLGGITSSFCDFLEYTGDGLIGQFYIHVTAVYNNNLEESSYNDSIYNQGIALSVEYKSTSEKFEFLSVTNENSSLKIQLNRIIKNAELHIVNITGQEVCNVILKNQNNIEISTIKFQSGIYLLNLKSENVDISKKILIK